MCNATGMMPQINEFFPGNEGGYEKNIVRIGGKVESISTCFVIADELLYRYVKATCVKRGWWVRNREFPFLHI